jgi:O-acetyl-ADP-ribose deacetylase (regulator of RNase III)
VIQLVLADVTPSLVACWRSAFADVPFVEAREGSIFDVTCDALVSPANSFGFMDGGIDQEISERLGWHVQARLQERIRERHHGELLVGRAELVATDDARVPWLIAAPTMRVPMALGPTVNAYLALRAVLLLVAHGSADDGRPVRDVVKTIACPGLGTGVGKLPSGICARQMRAAVGDVLLGEAAFPSTWRDARDRHHDLSH